MRRGWEPGGRVADGVARGDHLCLLSPSLLQPSLILLISFFPKSVTSKMFLRCPLVMPPQDPSSLCHITEAAKWSQPPANINVDGRTAGQELEAARRRDSLQSGWQGARSPAGPRGENRVEARCGTPTLRVPGLSFPVPVLFHGHCLQMGAWQWVGGWMPRCWQFWGQNPGARCS